MKTYIIAGLLALTAAINVVAATQAQAGNPLQGNDPLGGKHHFQRR